MLALAPGSRRQQVLLAVLGTAVFALAMVAVQREPANATRLLLLPSLVAVAVLTRRDAVTLLTAFLLLLFLIPSRYVVGPLGGAGTPAMVLAVGAAAWWAAGAVVPAIGRDRQSQPVRVALLLYGLTMLVSYAVAMLRPLTPLETRAADRDLLLVIALCGITLLAADGVTDRMRLDALLRRLVMGAAAVAGVGLVQFTTGFDLAAQINPPGLRLVGALDGIGLRGNLPRVSGTTEHAIEFALVLAMALPLAIHYALSDAGVRSRVARWTPVAAIVAAIPLALARSGVLGALIALVVLSLAWNRRERLRLFVLVALAPLALIIISPDLLAVITNLFTQAAADGSITYRIGRFAPVMEIVGTSPWVGIGLGTFAPETYFIVDNEYLVVLMESGVLGLLGLLAPFVVSAVVVRSVARDSADATTRHLAQALLASIAVAAFGLAVFGFLSFKVVSGVTFLLIGIAGALWRLHERGPLAPPPPLPPLHMASDEPLPPLDTALTARLRLALQDAAAMRILATELPGLADQQALTDAVLAEVVEGLRPRACAVWLRNRSGQLHITAAHGHAQLDRWVRLDGDHPLVAELASKRQPVLLRAAAARRRFPRVPVPAEVPLAVVPLHGDDDITGMLFVSREDLGRAELRWLATLADQLDAALAVGEVMRRRRLQDRTAPLARNRSGDGGRR